jgi:hypothetical protein
MTCESKWRPPRNRKEGTMRKEVRHWEGREEGRDGGRTGERKVGTGGRQEEELEEGRTECGKEEERTGGRKERRKNWRKEGKEKELEEERKEGRTEGMWKEGDARTVMTAFGGARINDKENEAQGQGRARLDRVGKGGERGGWVGAKRRERMRGVGGVGGAGKTSGRKTGRKGDRQERREREEGKQIGKEGRKEDRTGKKDRQRRKSEGWAAKDGTIVRLLRRLDDAARWDAVHHREGRRNKLNVG